MHRPITFLAALAIPVMTAAAPISYPPTATVPQADTVFGTAVKDPYRWLEGDVRTQKPVADWVAAQNKVTQAYLGRCPAATPSRRG